MVPALLIFGNKQFGISSTMRHICAACLPTKNPFFNYDWKKETWNLILALGIVLGGFVALNFMTFIPASEMDFKDKSELSYYIELNKYENNYPALSEEASIMFKKWHLNTRFEMGPDDLFSNDEFSIIHVLVFFAFGGFLVGFGTRWANGCTSGHAIMGLSLLNPGSLVAVIGFFIGGLIVSWFVIPILINEIL